MDLDDVIAKATPTDDPEEIGRFIDELLDAEDLTADERCAFAAGYFAGMSHAMAIAVKTRNVGDIIGEMMFKEVAWSEKDLL